MQLTELKEQATRILTIPDKVGEFSNHSYTCRSGGAPKNEVGANEVHRSETFAYRTTANGDAASGEVVVLCRETGAKDGKGRCIMITPEGVTFVFSFWPGSPESFDGGILQSPYL